jgi:pimeloyl-ACP methyl ester carboxylesterase
MPTFKHEGHKLAYTTYGRGDRWVVLLPGLLLSQRMHEPLARSLAEAGNRVVTLDPLGHGRSDRPRDMWKYGMGFFGEQAIALMDHLEIERGIVGGTSLGANTTLEVASRAPERLQGMLVDMPVLDNALLGCALAFTPALLMLTFGEPVMKAVQVGANLIPRGRLPFLADIGADWVRQDPGPGAAVMQGLFFNRVAPHRNERPSFEAPTLIIGHRRDPVHPFSDAGMLADELPNARLIEANSMFELRARPSRLTTEIVGFVDDCWGGPAPETRRNGTGAHRAANRQRRPGTKRSSSAKRTR